MFIYFVYGRYIWQTEKGFTVEGLKTNFPNLVYAFHALKNMIKYESL